MIRKHMYLALGGVKETHRRFSPMDNWATARNGAVSADPTPDLLVLSPNGSHIFMSLRGPNPLTADPHVSTGSTPGVGVVKVLEGSQSGLFESVAPASNIDAAVVERADMHALTIRVTD